MDTAPLGPQLQTPLCREWGGQAKLEPELGTFMAWAAHCKGKVGQCPCQERIPWLFLPFTACFRYPHPFPGSWILPHLKFRWLPSSSHPQQRTNPAVLQAPPHPPHHSKHKRGQVRAGHNPIPHPSPLSFPNPQPHAARAMEHPRGTTEPLMVMVVHVVEVGGCHGAERG